MNGNGRRLTGNKELALGSVLSWLTGHCSTVSLQGSGDLPACRWPSGCLHRQPPHFLWSTSSLDAHPGDALTREAMPGGVAGIQCGIQIPSSLVQEGELRNLEGLLSSRYFKGAKTMLSKSFSPQSLLAQLCSKPCGRQRVKCRCPCTGSRVWFPSVHGVLPPFLTGILAAPIRHLKQ